MGKSKGSGARVGLLVTLVLAWCTISHHAFAQGGEPIRIKLTEVENRYPDSLAFRIVIETTHALEKVTLYYGLRGDNSITSQPVEFDPGTEVTAVYTWDTSRITVAPSSPVEYHWEVRDDAGNTVITPVEMAIYDDLRFPWQELSNPELVVRWYQGDEDFGRYVYDTAEKALVQMEQQSAVNKLLSSNPTALAVAT